MTPDYQSFSDYYKRYQGKKIEILYELHRRGCYVSLPQFYNWGRGLSGCWSENYLAALSEITGIPKDKLFPNSSFPKTKKQRFGVF